MKVPKTEFLKLPTIKKVEMDFLGVGTYVLILDLDYNDRLP